MDSPIRYVDPPGLPLAHVYKDSNGHRRGWVMLGSVEVNAFAPYPLKKGDLVVFAPGNDTFQPAKDTKMAPPPTNEVFDKRYAGQSNLCNAICLFHGVDLQVGQLYADFHHPRSIRERNHSFSYPLLFPGFTSEKNPEWSRKPGQNYWHDWAFTKLGEHFDLPVENLHSVDFLSGSMLLADAVDRVKQFKAFYSDIRWMMWKFHGVWA